MEGAMRLTEILKRNSVIVLPPTEAFRSKEKDSYRKVIYIKAKEEHELKLCRDMAQNQITRDELLRQINIQFDINPLNLY